MASNLIKRDQGVKPTNSYEYEHLAFDFYASEPTEDLQLVVSYSWYPALLDEDMVSSELMGWIRYEDEEEETIEGLVDGMVQAQKFNSLRRHKNLASLLGYNCISESYLDGEFIHSWTAFSYPTSEKLNQALDQISPNEGLRFLTYDGDGRPNDKEFAEAFSENKVLIASEHSSQLVTHAYFETLGYLGLHGELLDAAKEGIAAVLERSKKIASSTSVEGIDDLKVSDIVYPPSLVLEKARTGLEVMAVQTGSAMFKPDRYSQHHDKTYLIGMYLNDLFFSRGLYDSSLVSILGLPKNTDFEQHAKAIERRYRKLNTAAGRLAVVS